MAIRALMVDVDGVLVAGRPEDGCHWQASMVEDLGVIPEMIDEAFFTPHWENVVLGRAGLMEHLAAALQQIAPHVSPETFVSYWFEKDSRLTALLLEELSLVRAAGIRVYLATNQEHLRAAYLMSVLRLDEHVDGIFYSADLGVKKPDENFFVKVQEAVDLRSEEILLIDDSLQNVDAARAVGWQAVHWTRQSSPRLLRGLCAPAEFVLRVATMDDVPALHVLIERSVRVLQAGDYSAAQMDGALGHTLGLDTQLIKDGTYFVASPADEPQRIAGSGGWSFRRTTFGSDGGPGREAAVLDPKTEAAKIRAIFIDPDFARRGLGSLILKHCEDAAVDAGFRSFAMGSTLTGVPLYTLKGYVETGRVDVPLPNGESLPVVYMSKEAARG